MRKFLIISVFIMSLFINAYALTGTDLSSRAVCPNIELGKANTDGSITKIECYTSYTDALNAMNSNEEKDLIILERKDNVTKVINAKYGLLYLDKGSDVLTYIYTSNTVKTQKTYINGSSLYGGTDASLLDFNYSNYSVKLEISGVTGWIKKDYYKIVPIAWVKSSSYYNIDNNYVRHYYTSNIEKTGTSMSYKIGPKVDYIPNGKYYSYDGHYFYQNYYDLIDDNKAGVSTKAVNKDHVYYNYYMYLPQRTRTNYTNDDMDTYFRTQYGFIGSIYGKTKVSKYSTIYGEADHYLNAEYMYGANAMAMLGISINESARGTSSLAIKKNNIFGHNAVDSSPFASGTSYLDIRSSINSHAYYYVNYGYSEVADSRYHGGHFGNKDTGMNHDYASDVYWGEKAASYYFDIDLSNGMKDYDYYQLVVSTGTNINVRTAPNTSSTSVYTIKEKNIPLVLIEEVEGTTVSGSNIWYKIQSESNINSSGKIVSSSSSFPKYNWNGYLYVHSSNFMKINDAKNPDGSYNKPIDVKSETSTYESYLDKDKTVKLGLVNQNIDYYYTSSLLTKKGTILKGSYITILEKMTSGDKTYYWVITDYQKYQHYWVDASKVTLVDNRDLLKVNIEEEGKYVSCYSDTKLTNSVASIYDKNAFAIIDRTKVDNKTLLKVLYSVTDSLRYCYIDGANSYVTYTSDFVDMKPVITASDQTIYVGDNFNVLAGVKAIDTEDGDITNKIKVTGSVDTTKKGTYKITYTVTDSFGNTVSKEVTITVLDMHDSNPLFMYNSLKHISDNTFEFSGFLACQGINNKVVTHKLIFVNENTNEEIVYNLANWQDYPYEMSSLDDKETYDYSGGWFKSNIDLTNLPVGDYKIYVFAQMNNYQTKTLFTNIAYMDMARRVVGKQKEYAIDIDYSTLNSPLLFRVREHLISTNIPQTLDNMYNFFYDLKLNDNKITIKGTSHSYGMPFGTNDNVKRELIFEDKTNYQVYKYDLGSITNGDYPITMAVSDNLDKTRAWFNKEVDLSNLPTGNYLVYIANTVNNITYYGELIDITYMDYSTINNTKYTFSRNDNIRLRMELKKVS